METTFRTVALLLGMGLLPLCANAQKNPPDVETKGRF